MRTVEMRLQPQELSETMAAMRIWLDERRFEPSSFTCHDCGSGVLVRIDFKVAEEADAFARCFGGSVDASPPSVVGQALFGRGSRTDSRAGRSRRLRRPQTTPSPRSASTSAALSPSQSPSASAVCSPSNGAGLTGATCAVKAHRPGRHRHFVVAVPHLLQDAARDRTPAH